MATQSQTSAAFSIPLDLTSDQAKQVSQKGYAPLETDTSEFYWIMSEDFLRHWGHDQYDAKCLLYFVGVCIDQILDDHMGGEAFEGWNLLYSKIVRLIRPRIDLNDTTSAVFEVD